MIKNLAFIMLSALAAFLFFACADLPKDFSDNNFRRFISQPKNESADSPTEPEELLEEIDLSALTEYYETLTEEQKSVFGSDFIGYIKKIISGEFEFGYSSFFSYILGSVGLSVAKILPLLASVIAVAVLIAFIGGVKGSFASSSVDGIVNFAGIALVASITLVQVFSVIKDTSNLVGSLKSQMEAVFPILFTLMTALGASGSIAVYQPAVAVLAFSVTEIIGTIALPLIISAVAFTVVGNLSKAVKLSGTSKFLLSAAKWILYTSFFLFTAFLSVQGVTAAVYDSVSVRTAKFALSKYVPVIGGYLSEGFNVILAGTALIKNAVGLSAVLLLFVSALPVLLKIIVTSLTFKLAGAITEPIEGGKIMSLMSGTAEAINLLVAVTLGVVFSYFLFLLLLVASGNLVL